MLFYVEHFVFNWYHVSTLTFNFFFRGHEQTFREFFFKGILKKCLGWHFISDARVALTNKLIIGDLKEKIKEVDTNWFSHLEVKS